MTKISEIIIDGRITSDGIKKLEKLCEIEQSFLNIEKSFGYSIPAGTLIKYRNIFSHIKKYYTREEFKDSIIEAYKDEIKSIHNMSIKEFRIWRETDLKDIL